MDQGERVSDCQGWEVKQNDVIEQTGNWTG